jgi:hypothetical protein
MTKEKKPIYESPYVMPLGELARGVGVACRPGSAPTGQCNVGAQIPPPVACTNGAKAGLGCTNGARFGR